MPATPLLSRRVVLVSGKGGTGKSALTAALAIRAARAGLRVLAAAMAGGPGLAAHFGVAELGPEPREVGRGIEAMAIERAAALDEYLHLQLRVPRAAPLRAFARGLDVFAEAVPGIRDVITVGKLLYDASSGPWDLVVADAPPTGQLVSYLRAPATIAGLAPSGRILEQAEWMAGLLADPVHSSLVLVALAEELSVSETREATAALDAEPLIDVFGVVANRVLPPPPVPDPVDLPAGPHRDAAELHAGRHAGQQAWLAELPDGPRLPYLFGLLTPGEVAARLADEWDQP